MDELEQKLRNEKRQADLPLQKEEQEPSASQEQQVQELQQAQEAHREQFGGHLEDAISFIDNLIAEQESLEKQESQWGGAQDLDEALSFVNKLLQRGGAEVGYIDGPVDQVADSEAQMADPEAQVADSEAQVTDPVVDHETQETGHEARVADPVAQDKQTGGNINLSKAVKMLKKYYSENYGELNTNN